MSGLVELLDAIAYYGDCRVREDRADFESEEYAEACSKTALALLELRRKLMSLDSEIRA